MLMLNGEVLDTPEEKRDTIRECAQCAVNWLLEKVSKGWPVSGNDFDELREAVMGGVK